MKNINPALLPDENKPSNKSATNKSLSNLTSLTSMSGLRDMSLSVPTPTQGNQSNNGSITSSGLKPSSSSCTSITLSNTTSSNNTVLSPPSSDWSSALLSPDPVGWHSNDPESQPKQPQYQQQQQVFANQKKQSNLESLTNSVSYSNTTNTHPSPPTNPSSKSNLTIMTSLPLYPASQTPSPSYPSSSTLPTQPILSSSFSSPFPSTPEDPGQLATSKETQWSSASIVANSSSKLVFESTEAYQKHFMHLVNMERDADQLATSKAVNNLDLRWSLVPHPVSNSPNLIATFDMSHKERSQYRIVKAARVSLTHPELSVPILGFIHSISRTGQISVIVDSKSFDSIGPSKYRELPLSSYMMTFIFDDSVYKRMEAALERMTFDSTLLNSYLGLPLPPNDPPSPHPTPTPSDNSDLNSNQGVKFPLGQRKGVNKETIKAKYLPTEIIPAPGIDALLNSSQINAILTSISTPLNIATVTGPPGTGKTTTLVNTVWQLHCALNRQYHAKLKKIDIKRGQVDPWNFDAFVGSRSVPEVKPKRPAPILVAAPSNVAVDHIASLLVKIPGLDVLRISSKRYRALKFAAADSVIENCALHKRIEAWLLTNPSSELGLLHARIFSNIDGDKQQTLMAKLDTVINDDSILSSHLDYTDELKLHRIQQDRADDEVFGGLDSDNEDDFDINNIYGKGATKKKPISLFRQQQQYQLQQQQAQQSDNLHHQDKQFTERLLTQLDIPVKAISSLSQAEMALWRKLYLELQYKLISSADVVCVTFALAGNPLLLGNTTFEHVILDEVSQSTEPLLLLPLMYNPRRLILFGDQQQLGPVVQSIEAAKLGFDRSLFCRLLVTKTASNCLLDTQYRMHPAIATFSSKTFYANMLKNGPNTPYHHSFSTKFPWPNANVPICFLSSNNYAAKQGGVNGEERLGTSIINPVECYLIESLLVNLIKMGIPVRSIGVVIPYKAQSHHLMSILCDPEREFAKLIEKTYFSHHDKNKKRDESNLVHRWANDPTSTHDRTESTTIELAVKFIEERLEIDSADSFQGREKPLIIFGCVRTSRSLGFLYDLRRMNVALTRAQHGLIVVGDHSALRQGTWGKLIDYFVQNQAFVQDTKAFIRQFDVIAKERLESRTNHQKNRLNHKNSKNNNNNNQANYGNDLFKGVKSNNNNSKNNNNNQNNNNHQKNDSNPYGDYGMFGDDNNNKAPTYTPYTPNTPYQPYTPTGNAPTTAATTATTTKSSLVSSNPYSSSAAQEDWF